MIDWDPAGAVPLVEPGIVASRAAGGGFELTGGRCPRCGRWSFPRATRCPDDGETPAPAVLGAEGRIYSYTIIATRPPLGLPQPYAIGFVDVEPSGMRLFMLLDPDRIGEIAIGAPVTLRVTALGVDGAGQPCARPFFALAG